MTPWSSVQSESSLEPMDERVGRDCNFFSCFFFSLFPFFSFSVLFCFVFEERVSLCILGCPKTHSVNHAILELTEICLPLPPWVLGWKACPHHHTPQPGWDCNFCEWISYLWVVFISVSLRKALHPSLNLSAGIIHLSLFMGVSVCSCIEGSPGWTPVLSISSPTCHTLITHLKAWE